MYGLLTTSPFRLPTDPGPLAIYYPPPVSIIDAAGNLVLNVAGMPMYQNQPTITCAEQAAIDARFKRAKNYWELYMNIQRAVYSCLNDNINNAFKVSNNPALVGWNLSIEPRDIFNQIMATYGRPNPAALLLNDTLFWSVYSPQDAPKVLFCCIEDCQEVQATQQCCTPSTRDFEDWDRKAAADMIWTNLKMFVQECYTR
jgi:hypothetical protein